MIRRLHHPRKAAIIAGVVALIGAAAAIAATPVLTTLDGVEVVSVPSHLTDAQICASGAPIAWGTSQSAQLAATNPQRACRQSIDKLKPGIRAYYEAKAREYLQLRTPRETAAEQQAQSQPIGQGAPPIPSSQAIPVGVPITDPANQAGFTNINAWIVPDSIAGPHGNAEVFAGYETADPQQGAILRDAGGSLQLDTDGTIAPTPVKGGAATIVGGQGAIVLLRLANGATERYNSLTGKFVG